MYIIETTKVKITHRETSTTTITSNEFSLHADGMLI